MALEPVHSDGLLLEHLSSDLHEHILNLLSPDDCRSLRLLSRSTCALLESLADSLSLSSSAALRLVVVERLLGQEQQQQPGGGVQCKLLRDPNSFRGPFFKRFTGITRLKLHDGKGGPAAVPGSPGSVGTAAACCRAAGLPWGCPMNDELVEALLGCQGAKEALQRVKQLDVKLACYLGVRGMSALLSCCPMLTDLRTSRWADASTLLLLPHLRNLRVLDLGDAEVDILSIDDSAMPLVGQCKQLRSLSLARCVLLTDDGAASALSSLTSLEHLSVAGTRLSGSCLASAPLAALTSFDASGCASFGDEGLAALLRGCSNSSSSTGVASSSSTAASGSSCAGSKASAGTLRQLVLGQTRVSNTGLALLQQAPKLAHLDLGSGFELNDLGLAALVLHCPNLVGLTLGNFNLTRPPAEGCLASLRQLKFGGAYLTRGLRHVFPRLAPGLARVEVAGYDTVVDAHLGLLAAQRSLHHVVLTGGYTLTPTGLMALAQLPALRVLQLTSCPLISEDSARQLMAACPSLAQFELRRVQGSPSGAKAGSVGGSGLAAGLSGSCSVQAQVEVQGAGEAVSAAGGQLLVVQ